MTGLRIAMALPNLDLGGMETVTISLSRCLQAFGHEVQFLLTQNAGAQANDVAGSGLKCTVLPLHGKRSLLPSPTVRSWLQSERIDVLHTHSGDWFKLAPNASRTSGLTLIHTQHGLAEEDLPSRWLRRRAARHTDFFVAVSEEVAAQLRQRTGVPGDRIEVVPNGVDTQAFHPATPEQRLRARAEMGVVPGTGTTIGVVARMDAIKNHGMVLRAFTRLHADYPDVELVLIGTGPLESEVRALADQSGVRHAIRILGARADVPSLLPGFDIVALGSRSEGTSITLLEAMASGIPCVATEVGGTGALLGQGRYGVLVPDNDEESFARALAGLVTDEKRRSVLASAARRHVMAAYSMESLARSYERIYRSSRVKSGNRS